MIILCLTERTSEDLTTSIFDSKSRSDKRQKMQAVVTSISNYGIASEVLDMHKWEVF